MTEDRETMVKRLRMRSMRRGIKEMDLILAAFCDRKIESFDQKTLGLYDSLLSENDHDLYGWVGGQIATPAQYLDLVTDIAAGAHGVVGDK